MVYSSATLHTPQEVVQSNLLENTAMSIHPQPIDPVLEDTAHLARAAFPKGNLYMRMRDVLGTIYDDEEPSLGAILRDKRRTDKGPRPKRDP